MCPSGGDILMSQTGINHKSLSFPFPVIDDTKKPMKNAYLIKKYCNREATISKSNE